MGKSDTSELKEKMRLKLRLILEILGLEVPAFSILTKISESHIYALLNGNRDLLPNTARKIAKSIGLDPIDLVNIELPIPGAIRKFPLVKKIYQSYPDNPEYFLDKRKERKISYAFIAEVVNGEFLLEERFVSEIVTECRKKNLMLSSKQVAQQLEYLAKTNVLESVDKPILKKNGESGSRIVKIYKKKKTS